jgi:hypothetical protein
VTNGSAPSYIHRPCDPPGGYYGTLAGSVFQHVDVLRVLDALFRDGPRPPGAVELLLPSPVVDPFGAAVLY